MDDRARGDGESAGTATWPLLVLAGCWIGGIILAGLIGTATIWMLVAIGPAVAMGVWAVRARPRAARLWALLAIVPLAAAWTLISQDQVSEHHIGHYLGPGTSLGQLTGIVEGEPAFSSNEHAAFGAYDWAPPATRFVLRVRSIMVDGQMVRCTGRLLVKIRQVATSLAGGDHIGVAGWLSPVRGPDNPGERDFRPYFARRRIDGHLTLARSGNWWRLEPGRTWLWQRLRHRIADMAASSLRLGMAGPDPAFHQRLAMLDALLIGRRSGELRELSDSFRRVGLAHLLSISGAHLAILLGLVWALARLATGHPRHAALIVRVVLGCYLTVVPWRVPIVRASIMAALFTGAYLTGRLARPLELAALAALLVLIWRPLDLTDPGFQLSFGCVAALLLFTRRLSHWFYRPSLVPGQGQAAGRWWARLAANYVAANLVAFLAAMPLVAYHFEFISPLTVAFSLVAVPVVTVTMGLGFAKMVLGLFWPTIGMLLAEPAKWATDLLIARVGDVATWPLATIELARGPSAVWTVAALGVVASLLAGWFARRRLALVATLVLCGLWLIVQVEPAWAKRLNPWRAQPPIVQLNMLSVADGSCYLLQITPQTAERHVIMFDCGSLTDLNVGRHTVVPALRRLGIGRIHTVLLSHADIDHFCGLLDVVDQIAIDRVLMPPQMWQEAQRQWSGRPSAVAYLLMELRRRGVDLQVAARGWQRSLGKVDLELIWPPSDLVTRQANDASLVLSVRIDAGRLGPMRQILLNGDIQQEPMTELLDGTIDLAAAVCDLPHHGSFVATSPRWLGVVDPRFVLQSCGPRRLESDQWAGLLEPRGLKRFVTARDGMVELRFDLDGRISWSTFGNGAVGSASAGQDSPIGPGAAGMPGPRAGARP